MPLLAPQMTENEAKDFSKRPDVQSVSPNDPVTVVQQQPTGGPTVGPTSGPTAAPAPAPPQFLYPLTQQVAAAWNLNRLIHPSLPLGTDFNFTSDGTGVNVYVVDTVRALATQRFTLCRYSVVSTHLSGTLAISRTYC